MGIEGPSGLLDSPYKGLSSYSEEDAALFAGRDSDIAHCAAALADWSTRILVLHGLTGCGKSSFLKAGVIPYLENGGSGIAFARRGVTRDVFISSTADPLAKLANALFEFASNEIVVETPAGARNLNLRSAFPDSEKQDAAAFVRAVGKEPSLLLGVLEKLSLVVPETLVLIIDQGEEVLTLTNPRFHVPSRDAFFDFLSEFATAQFDMKILVSLRTEYLGRFVSQLRLGFKGSGIGDYYLNEMDEAQIKEALLHPTRPDSRYQFSIEDGVIDTAIEQLQSAPLGRLGALQIVFTELYGLMNPSGPRIITAAMLAGIGNVEGSIERFVHKELYSHGMENGLTPGNAQEEATVWREALCDLVRYQPDGTVTTDIKRVSDLQERLKNSRLDFDQTTKALLAAGLLKPVSVVDGHGKLVRCYGIGHDTVGLVLWKWQSRVSPVLSSDGELEEKRPSPGRDIALCLSGGGYRSMLFDLGAVWRLNELGYLPKLGRVSGVAGGAVVTGVLAMQWKDLSFKDGVVENFRSLVAEPLLEFAGLTVDTPAILLGLLPFLNPVELLSKKFESVLFGDRTLQDMPDEPVFVFSCTNLQHVSLFRLSKSYIGDPNIGRVRNYPLKLATAVAASNALPPLLSPLILDLSKPDWDTTAGIDARFRERVYLATGSVIDNLGLEAAWSHHRTILVCDGGVDSPDNPKPETNMFDQAIRTVEVIDHQLRNLRRRQVAEAFRSQNRKGAYWSIRNFSEYGLGFDLTRAAKLAALATRFKRLDEKTKRDLVNLGYEICDAALVKDFEKKPRIEKLQLPYA